MFSAAAFILSLAAVAGAHEISNAAELEKALADARGGEMVELVHGEYGALALSGRIFSERVTIKAADHASPPRFKSITLIGVKGLSFDGVIVELGPARPMRDYAVTIRRSANIDFSNFDVSSASDGVIGNDGYGFMIRDSKGVTLSSGKIHDIFRGVSSLDNDDVKISTVSFTKFGSDGVVARGAVGLTIEECLFTGAALVDPLKYHPDGIQIWSRGAVRANQNIVIRNNRIIQGDGDSTQGVFIRTQEIQSKNITVDSNEITQSRWQGIFVENANGVSIRKNRVTPSREGSLPGIELRAPIENANTEHNIAASWRLAPGVTSVDDISTDPRRR